jgi:hypothetical protein
MLLDGEPLQGRSIHWPIEERITSRAPALGEVHCEIGIAQQRRCIASVPRINRDADTGRNNE